MPEMDHNEVNLKEHLIKPIRRFLRESRVKLRTVDHSTNLAFFEEMFEVPASIREYEAAQR